MAVTMPKTTHNRTKAKQPKTEKKTHPTKNKAHKTQNRHCEHGQLSWRKEMSYASSQSHQYGVKNQSKHGKEPNTSPKPQKAARVREPCTNAFGLVSLVVAFVCFCFWLVLLI